MQDWVAALPTCTKKALDHYVQTLLCFILYVPLHNQLIRNV